MSANLTVNEKKAKYIGNRLQTKNGIITYTGTQALLSALKLSRVNPLDNVLISGYCCYSLYEAIKNIGAMPIIIKPANFYNITEKEIEDVLLEYDIKCFIATHQYGIVQDIKPIKEKYPNLSIIEDIAQAWNIKENELGTGGYSDFVVTSFGVTKPLSYGIGGAVFSKKDIGEYFDLHDRNSRDKSNILLPTAFYQCQNIDEYSLVDNADKIVEHQREVAKYLEYFFEKDVNVKIYKDKNNQTSSWQRFPIILKDAKYLPYIERILKKYNINYQLQNEKELWELPMVKNQEHILYDNNVKPLYILIRTRQNNVADIKKLVKEGAGL